MELVISSRLKHGEIVRAMNLRGWTGKQTAAFLGMNEQTFYMMVNLKWVPKRPSADLELSLLDLTGKTVNELFPGDVLTPEFISLDKRAEVFVDSQLLLSGKFPFFQLQAGPEEALYRKDLPAAIVTAMENVGMKPRYMQVIYMRFFQDFTLEETGKVLGIKRERVRQMEATALRKLRHPRASRALREYAEVLGI